MGYASTSYKIRPTTHYVSSNTAIYAGFTNDSESATSSTTTVTFYLLWLKGTAKE